MTGVSMNALPIINAPPTAALAHASIRAAAVTVALALTLAGCGEAIEESAVEAAIESATGGEAEVDRDGNRTTIRTPDGGEMSFTSGDDLPLPSDYPDDVYLPDDYRVHSVVDTFGGGRAIGLTVDGEAAAVMADVRTQMADHGWQQVMAMQHEQGQMVSYQKDDRMAALTVNPAAEGEVRVGITVRTQQ